MSDWHFEVEGFKASLDVMIAKVTEATRMGVVQGAALIERNAKLHFGPQHPRGTPKTVFDRPQSVTSALKRSIHLIGGVQQIGHAMFSAEVGPTVIYGRRIELGFHGTDSIGRRYSQPAYAYMAPAVQQSRPFLEGLFVQSWQRAMGS